MQNKFKASQDSMISLLPKRYLGGGISYKLRVVYI